MIRVFTKTKKRMVVIGAVIALLVFGGYRVFIAPSQTPQQVVTQKVQKGTITSTISGSGQISSANSIPVETSVSGIVSEVYVKNGETVAAGDPIMKLTLDASSKQKQASAYANYLSAVNSVKTSQSAKLSADAAMWSDQQSVLDAQNSVNAKNDNNQNPTTKEDYTDLEKQSIESSLVGARKSFTASEQKYKDADAATAAAQAAMSSSYLSYQQTLDTVYAPIGGTVNGVTLRSGMTITGSTSSSSSSSTSSTSSSNSTSGSSQKIAVVQTDAVPAITVNASEVDITTLAEGQKATITLDALPGKTFTGHVEGIDTTGSVSSGVTTYPVVVVFDSEAAGVYPNMAATANIVTASKENVLVVPTSAIQTTNGRSTVRVKSNGRTRPVMVKIGITSDTETEILSGLSEGDEIVTSMPAATSTSSTRTGTSASPFGGGFGSGGGVRVGGGAGGTGGGTTRQRSQ